MCGRFTMYGGRDLERELQERFGFVEQMERRVPVAVPRWNIAPAQAILTIVSGPGGGRRLEPAIWGFRPAWLVAPQGPPPINAMAETLLDRPLWRGPLRSGRCLVPASGFYEWAAVAGARRKQPMHVRRRDGALFAFAGLWARDADGNPTCALVTTAPNSLMAPIHRRMPAILVPVDEETWLDSEETSPAALLACLQPYPADELEAYPVSPRVGDVHQDGADLVEPASPNPSVGDD